MFCSVRAAELGLQRPKNGKCWQCEVLDGIPQRVGFDATGVEHMSLRVPAAVYQTAEEWVELPAPFTIIGSRSPLVGDYIVTLVMYSTTIAWATRLGVSLLLTTKIQLHGSTSAAAACMI